MKNGNGEIERERRSGSLILYFKIRQGEGLWEIRRRQGAHKAICYMMIMNICYIISVSSIIDHLNLVHKISLCERKSKAFQLKPGRRRDISKLGRYSKVMYI